MKKRCVSLLLVVLTVVILSACGSKADNDGMTRKPATNPREESKQGTEQAEKKTEDTPSETENTLNETPEPGFEANTEAAMEGNGDSNEDAGGVLMEGNVDRMVIEVGGQKFSLTLYDNETVRALKEQLPMTINMEELHGNEKFYYLDEELPVNSEEVGSIKTGDLMLFGSDCLVLFFEDFNTSYSYTRIGHVDNAESFANDLAGGTVKVSFETGEEEDKS